MVEPHLQSSLSPKGYGTLNRPISQWLCCNYISIWFFLPRAAVTLVNSSTPELSNLDPPLLHTLVPPSFIKLLNPGIKGGGEEKGGGKKKGIRKKYIWGKWKKGNSKKIKK